MINACTHNIIFVDKATNHISSVLLLTFCRLLDYLLHNCGHIQNIVSFDDAAGDKVRAHVLNGKYAATGRGSSKFLAHSMLEYNRERKVHSSVKMTACVLKY